MIRLPKLSWLPIILIVIPAAFIGCKNASLAGTDAGNSDKVEGVIANEEGIPIVNAAVYLRTFDFEREIETGTGLRAGHGFERTTRTLAQGKFSIVLGLKDTGQFVLETVTEGIRGRKIIFQRKTSEHIDLGKIRMEKLGRIIGTARLPDGDAGDILISLPGTSNQTYLGASTRNFDFQSIPAGSYLVRIQGLVPVRNSRDTLVDLKSGDTLKLDLLAGKAVSSDGPGSVSVRLLRPGVSAGTLLARLSNLSKVLAADSTGALTFDGVPPGNYTLSAWGENPYRDTVRLTGIVVAPGRVSGPVSLGYKIRALIVDGLANNDWLRMTRYNTAILKESGLFEVAVSTLPPGGATPAQWAAWHPLFADYDVVILHCNSGELDDGKANPWPDSMKQAMETFVATGGGLVNTQATFHGYLNWPAFETMHGLVWRGGDFPGPSYQLDSLNVLVPNPAAMDSATLEIMTPGGVGELMTTVNPSHPINLGLPKEWRHAPSLLVYRMKGSISGMTVLSYSVNPSSGAHEPQQWTKTHGMGRVFTTVLADLAIGATNFTYRCAGYQTVFIRGTEWAATGRVTSPVPADFPKRDSVSYRNNIGP